MLNVLLIDDEPLAREILKEYLQDMPDVHIAGECGDGFEALKAISQDQPDLIFLDIQMPKISGFELLELLDTPPHVIFTTAFDSFAMQAFESNAVDYLLKPFDRERFTRAMQKFRLLDQGNAAALQGLVQSTVTQQPAERVVIRDGSRIRIIPSADISYLEASDDYVKVHSAEGVFLKKRTMQQFEGCLPSEQFIRVHRSYLLNLRYLNRLEPFEKDQYIALLKDGTRVPVSKSGYQRLRQVLDI